MFKKRQECAKVFRKGERCAQMFKKREVCAQVFRKRQEFVRYLGREKSVYVFRKIEEFIVLLIELHVACLVFPEVKWIGSVYKIKPIRLIFLPRLHSKHAER